MKNVRLIRHGESAANAGEASLDHASIHLTLKGIEQANLVARSFNHAPDLIVTSPLSRAQATTMATLPSLMVKARYIGASSMYAWQFGKAQQVALANGWSKFVPIQNYLNLVYREEEREMIPLCADQGVGVMPWSPMARGRLTRPNGQQTVRTKTDISGQSFYKATEVEDGRVIDVVEQVAGERGVPMAQVALAWVLSKRGVSAPIVGASKATHPGDSISALELVLTDDEIKRLEAPYVPHAVTGFS